MIRNGEKYSVYLPDEMHHELKKEAKRLDRSVSWLVQRAWRIARGQIAEFPAAPPVVAAATELDENDPRAA